MMGTTVMIIIVNTAESGVEKCVVIICGGDGNWNKSRRHHVAIERTLWWAIHDDWCAMVSKIMKDGQEVGKHAYVVRSGWGKARRRQSV